MYFAPPSFDAPSSNLEFTWQPAKRRLGFTLIEIIVVIAIIAILVALLAAAVMPMLGKGPEVQCASEISALDMAIQSFMQTYKVKYIPSRLVLCEYYGDYHIGTALGGKNPATQVDLDSVDYLQKVWPHLLDPNANGTPPAWQNPKVGIDWNGNGKLDKTRVTLTGDQCLVFFLGGIPSTGTTPFLTNGFGTDPRNPSIITATSGNVPTFDFTKSGRLNLPTANNNGFLNYLNPYSTAQRQAYAYFSSYGNKNGYNPYDKAGNTPTATTGAKAPYSDCHFLVADDGTGANTALLMPYIESTAPLLRYYNFTGYQIIASGGDGIYGLGGQWTPATAANMPLPGKDDQTNFVTGLMASGGN